MPLSDWFPQLLGDPQQPGVDIPFGADASEQQNYVPGLLDAPSPLPEEPTTLLGYPLSQLQPQNSYPDFTAVRGLLTDTPGVALAPSPYPNVPPILNSTLLTDPGDNQGATTQAPDQNAHNSSLPPVTPQYVEQQTFMPVALTNTKQVDMPNMVATSPLNTQDQQPLALQDNQKPRFASNINPSDISNQSLTTLDNIAKAANIPTNSLLITSTQRTPQKQAAIMYDQLESGNISRYGPQGQAVIDLYKQSKAAGFSPDEIKQRMTDMIQDKYNNGEIVSQHLGDPAQINVFDIAPSSIPLSKRADFENALNDARRAGYIDKYLGPNRAGDPSYHLEIKQRRR
jgi:hypothetical protein